jgi:ketosteroid isomerase-like protein
MQRAAQALAAISTEQPRSSAISMPMAVHYASSFSEPARRRCASPKSLPSGRIFMSQQDLEAGFKAWQDALNRGDMETFFAAMDDDIVIYDEDIPWRFSKADMIDHLSFHAKVWDAFQWVPRELRFQTRGDTGIVSGFATFRGKPKDAGFRQRFMGLTQTWMRKGTGWTMLSWHQGPLNGQLDGLSKASSSMQRT